MLTIGRGYRPNASLAIWFPKHLRIAMQIDMEQNPTRLKAEHEEPLPVCRPIITYKVAPVLDDDVLQFLRLQVEQVDISVEIWMMLIRVASGDSPQP